jgi:iron complex transport system permease protein
MAPVPSGPRATLVIGGLAIALLVTMVAGVLFGAVPIRLGDLAGALSHAFSGIDGSLSDRIIVDVRLPRVILAALVGASLALAGALYQALFKNPLADPYILGVSAGAGLGATLALGAVGTSYAARALGVPAGAFAGAAGAMLLVVRLASRRGRLDSTSLLLAGVAVSYTLAALTSFVLVFERESMQSVVFWMMGGLGGASWGRVVLLAAMFALGAAVPFVYHRELDVMLLGDERAGQLGVAVERFKLVALACASFVVAGAVAVSGLIGFVGLMTPHMVRLVLGARHRLLLPASVLAGAIVLVGADLAARVVLAPVELPVGIVTALAGGPFFVWLLVRKERAR